MLQIIALKTNCYFAIGPWVGGQLTSLYGYTSVPGCIINCGLFYIKNLYNEARIISVPCINLMCNTRFFKVFSISYSNPLYVSESSSLHSICYFFGFIVKKYKQDLSYIIKNFNDFDYNLIFFNKLNAISHKMSLYPRVFNTFLNFQHFRFKIIKSLIFIKRKNYLLFAFFNYLQKIMYYKKYYIPVYLKKRLNLKNKLKNKKKILFKMYIYVDLPVFYMIRLNVEFINAFLYKKIIFYWFKSEIDLFSINKLLINEF